MRRIGKTGRPAKPSTITALAFSAVVVVCAMACTRAHYRNRADSDVYQIVAEHTTDPHWRLPERPVEADRRSRLADSTDPDRSPLPPDDAAANVYTPRAHRKTARRRGVLKTTEDEAWRDYLPTADDGSALIGRGSAMELGLLHSREYQDRVEGIYLAALGLSFERFEFAIQWFANNSTSFEHFGKSSLPNERNTLRTNTSMGFTRSLATGGQIITDFANSFVWEFTGKDVNTTSSGLLIALTQPLLRGAFHGVRVEALTQAERLVLYEVRNFSRFRRQFYVDVAGASGFLGLLSQLQGIRNQEANLERLERNLEEHRALADAEQIALIQVDQVFQEYQQGRLSLLTAQNAFATAFDAYKTRLGLPPDLAVTLDDAILERFELNDPRLDRLQTRLVRFDLSLRRFDETPPREEIEQALKSLIEQQGELSPILDRIAEEVAQWKGQIETRPAPVKPEIDAAAGEMTEYELQQERLAVLEDFLKRVRQTHAEDLSKSNALLKEISTADHDDTWKRLQEFVRRDYSERLADAFVIQTQVRTFLIDLSPVEVNEEEAIELALAQRVDLMNDRARVVDAWRRVEVAANGLKADLGLSLEADFGTDPDHDNPFAFDASASRYRVGIEFDSPLVRRRERNEYRALQIAYQRARRQYMAAADQIRSQIRRDVRDIKTNRLQFEISRRRLLVAARQVELAQIEVRSAFQSDSSVTRDLLDALRSLLDARNNLISSWVSFENSRMNLFRDLDLMEINEQGVWINEDAIPGTTTEYISDRPESDASDGVDIPGPAEATPIDEPARP